MNRWDMRAWLCIALVVAGIGAAAAQSGRRGGVLDVNTASDKELLSVPGITAAIAKGIMDRRPFLTVSELDTFLGQSLSREQRTTAYDRLFLQVNLNTATDAEI